MSKMSSAKERDPLLEAYNLVRNEGKKIRTAARICEVPESTLRSRLKNPNLFDSSVGHPPLLSKDEEVQLVEHLRTMSSLGYSYSRSQVLNVAANVVKVTGREKVPKKDWYYSFLKRFPDLAVNKSQKKDISKLTDTSQENIKKYFKEYEAVLEKYDLKDKAEHIWTVGVVGIAFNETKGKKPSVVSGDKSVTSTVILAGSALGETIPPLVTYKGQRLTKDLTTGCITQSQFAVTNSGWPSSQTFMDFLEKLFISHVSIRPCVILYDGNSTYITVDVIRKAKENDIHLFILPPHLVYQARQADTGIFKPFKSSFIAECDEMFEAEDGYISRSDIPELVADAFQNSVTVANLISGFKQNGLVPFDPTVVSPQIPKIILKTHKPSKKNKQGKTTIVNKSLLKTVLIESQPKETKTKKRKPGVEHVKRKAKKIKLDMSYKKTRTGKSKKRKRGELCVNSDESKPGPSGQSHETLVKKEKESEDEDSEQDFCRVCNLMVPSDFNQDNGLEILSWAKCEGCDGWVHLKYCTEVREKESNKVFRCPKCLRAETT